STDSRVNAETWRTRELLLEASAHTEANEWGAAVGLGVLAVHAAAGDLAAVPVAALHERGARAVGAAHQLPDVAGQVVDVEGAARGGVGAGLVGAVGEGAAAVGDVDVGVVGLEVLAV